MVAIIVVIIIFIKIFDNRKLVSLYGKTTLWLGHGSNQVFLIFSLVSYWIEKEGTLLLLWPCIPFGHNYSVMYQWLFFSMLTWRDIICYNLPLLLTPLSVGSSKVRPCGDQWHNFITSVAVFGVWVIANCIYVPHFSRFNLSSDLCLSLCLGYFRYHCRECWAASVSVNNGFS